MSKAVKKVVSKATLGTINLDRKTEQPKATGGTSYNQEDMDEANRGRRQRNATVGRKKEVNTTLTRTDTLG